MYECEYKDWINEYGHNEGYLYKDLSSYMTGHCYRGSIFETDDSCGNCDGARCANCHENYIVSSYSQPMTRVTKYGLDERKQFTHYERFDSYKDAKERYDSIK